MDLVEIKEEIAELEQSDTTWQNIEKLAWLYIIRDNLKEYSFEQNESEFLAACQDADIQSLLELLDEHMEVVKVLHPKEYKSLIERIHQL